MKRFIWGVLLLALMLTFSCTPVDDTEGNHRGGSGSEIVGVVGDSTNNPNQAPAKVAVASQANGLPVAMGPVYLYPRNFLRNINEFSQTAVPEVLTGQDGSFRIRNVTPGEYMLEAGNNGNLAVSRVILVPEQSTSINLDTLWVKPTAAVSIKVNFALAGDIEYYLMVRGTRLIAKGTSNGIQVTLDDIPVGVEHTITLQVVKPVPRTFDFTGVRLSPGVTIILDEINIS